MVGKGKMASQRVVLPVDGKARSGGSCMLFLHGGGYQWYSPSHPYRLLTTRLASCTGLPILAIDYRLWPRPSLPCRCARRLIRPRLGLEAWATA